jgi:hypothetical protein
MNDTKIHIFYQFGDIDTIDVDSVANRWSIDDGLFIIDTRNGEPIFIGNMDSIVCIKIENCEAENFPKNKKEPIDSDLRISAGIMRDEYRNNPEFRQSVYASMESAFYGCKGTDNPLQAAVDRLFDYEADSNN